MKTSNGIGWLALCSVLLTACVSETSGRIIPEGDNLVAAEANYQLGARYYKSGKFELARDRLVLATELNPKMAIGYSTLALAYEALDRLRLATEAYEAAVRAEPRNFEVRNAYAVFHCRQENYDEAAKHFDKAISHPKNDDAHIAMTNAGVCMQQKPDAQRAERYFRAALDREEKYGEALIQICLLKFQEKDYLSSRAFLQRFMVSNATTSGVLYLASRIEDMLGNDRGRVDYENQLLRSYPASAEARKVLSTR
jgi:type IV pilus assembly protein PilF